MNNSQISLADNFKEFAALLEKGDSLEAIERFFADDIQQYENNQLTFSGKQKSLEEERNNLDKVTQFSALFANVGIDFAQQRVWGEMILTFDSKKTGKMLLEEAFFQQWENGKIKVQKFYYKGIQQQK